ncbi:MAG: KH domain-containing protein [Nanoarchaeota archaeon]|nr:KH domain-containing protein [Nanoarchaeota archaeon]
MTFDIHEEKFYLEKDRISVFIGKEGETKKTISKHFNSEIDVDSKTGEVLVESENAVDGFVLSQVIQAINFGHNPEKTLVLEDENMVFDIIDVKPMVRDHLRLKTVMGRIIGKEGSTRKAIEEITKCNIAVKDHYVSIIGAFENVGLVHEALDMLIKGGSHKSMYGYLERNKVNSNGF